MRARLLFFLGVTALCVSGGVLAGEPESPLTGALETEHFTVRCRPGSRAAASAEREGAMAERDFADICRQLEFTPDGRFTLWLYDDVAEIARITGVKGAGAFSAGRDTHCPRGQDQSRYHELVHVVAVRMPKSGPEERNLFLVEGLANALLTYVHDVHVDAVAKFYLARDRLPPLETFLEGDFYAWQRAHPGFDAYDVGGSFVRFLVDRYGIGKTKRYYTGTPAKQAFGVGLDVVETAWREHLDAYVLRPEVEILLRQRDGEAVDFDGVGPGVPEKWTSLLTADLRPRDGTEWKREDGAIRGSGPGGWHVADLGTKKYGDCAVKARIRTEDIRAGVQIQLGDGAAAMLVGNGTFVWRHDGGTGMSPARTVPPNGEVELMLVRRGGRMEVWVDGVRLAGGEVDANPAPVGIGFHSGTVRFLDVEVGELE